MLFEANGAKQTKEAGHDDYSKHIEIKPDRRLSLELDLPPDLPLGRATLQLAITPETPTAETGSLREAVEKAGGAVALVRQWREEWPESFAGTGKQAED